MFFVFVVTFIVPPAKDLALVRGLGTVSKYCAPQTVLLHHWWSREASLCDEQLSLRMLAVHHLDDTLWLGGGAFHHRRTDFDRGEHRTHSAVRPYGGAIYIYIYIYLFLNSCIMSGPPVRPCITRWPVMSIVMKLSIKLSAECDDNDEKIISCIGWLAQLLLKISLLPTRKHLSVQVIFHNITPSFFITCHVTLFLDSIFALIVCAIQIQSVPEADTW